MNDRVASVLAAARDRGALGPRPVEVQLRHCRAFARVVGPGASVWSKPAGADGRWFADLGSGGGVPALALLAWLPQWRAYLVERSASRVAWLREAARILGVGDRAVIWGGDGERAGHDAGLRERFELITARGLGSPGYTAELASGLVRVGGRVVVSDDPGRLVSRWPGSGLGQLGLVLEHRVRTLGANLVVLRKVAPAPPWTPRTAAGRRPRF